MRLLRICGARNLLQIDAVERIGDDVIFDPRAVAGDEDGRVVVRSIASRNRRCAIRSTSRRRPRSSRRCLCRRRESRRLARRSSVSGLLIRTSRRRRRARRRMDSLGSGRIDPLLQRRGRRSRSPGQANASAQNPGALCSHLVISLRENHPASTMSTTERTSRYAPAMGKLDSRKFAICFTPDEQGVNGLICTGACGSRSCPYW